MVIYSIEPERFVLVEECSTNTSRCGTPSLPMGASWRAGAPESSSQLGQEHNVALSLSSIGKRMGMGASLVVEGSTNLTVFETYLEDVLCPTLERGVR
jgi:hypothetical protein